MTKHIHIHLGGKVKDASKANHGKLRDGLTDFLKPGDKIAVNGKPEEVKNVTGTSVTFQSGKTISQNEVAFLGGSRNSMSMKTKNPKDAEGAGTEKKLYMTPKGLVKAVSREEAAKEKGVHLDSVVLARNSMVAIPPRAKPYYKDSAKDSSSVSQAEKELAQHERMMRVMGEKASSESRSDAEYELAKWKRRVDDATEKLYAGTELDMYSKKFRPVIDNGVKKVWIGTQLFTTQAEALAFAKKELAKKQPSQDAYGSGSRHEQKVQELIKHIGSLKDTLRKTTSVKEKEEVQREIRGAEAELKEAEKRWQMGSRDSDPEAQVKEAIAATAKAMDSSKVATKKGTRDNHMKAFVAHSHAALAWAQAGSAEAKVKVREHEDQAHFHHSNALN